MLVQIDINTIESGKFLSTDSMLGEYIYNRIHVSRIFLESTEVNEGHKNIKS